MRRRGHRGARSGDTITGVVPVVEKGEGSGTGTKTITLECTSNPVITATASTDVTYGSSGAHGASPTAWYPLRTPVSASPSVTLGNSPVLKLVKTATTTRTACVDFMGMYVAYIPLVVTNPEITKTNIIQLLAQ